MQLPHACITTHN